MRTILRRCALTLVSVLNLLPGMVQAASGTPPPLEFHWPLPARVGVTTIIARGETQYMLHETVSLAAGSFPSELELRREQELWDCIRDPAPTPQFFEGYSNYFHSMEKRPPTIISSDGQFLRNPSIEDLIAYGERQVQSKADSTPKSMLTPEATKRRAQWVRAQPEIDDKTSWESWVGNWIGLQLKPGEQNVTREPVLRGGVSVPSVQLVMNEGPTGPGGAFITLTYMTRPIPNLTGMELSREDTTFLRRVVLEPKSMRPIYAEYAWIATPGDSSSPPRSLESHDYFFEWNPPLASSLDDSIPKAGLDAFQANRLSDAMDVLMAAVLSGSRNPGTYAYLGEACRRLGLVGEGALFAKRAIELAPCHSMAHTVLSTCFNSQVSGWARGSIDTTRAELLRAVACDSTDGNAWMNLVLVARHWERPDLERRSLTKLLETGFLTENVQAYSRWMLRELPESTVLITNGDMDSYPAWALQAVRRIRPDVAVINYGLLRKPWYLRYARNEMRVPLPFRDQDLDTLEAGPDAAQLHERVLRSWWSARNSGEFCRPLAISLTVPSEDLPPGILDRATWVGPAQLCGVGSKPDPADTTAIRKGLALVTIEDFAGPRLSERDWSPIRRNGGGFTENVLRVWLDYVETVGKAGRTNEARNAFGRASNFARKTGVTPALQIQMAKLRTLYGP